MIPNNSLPINLTPDAISDDLGVRYALLLSATVKLVCGEHASVNLPQVSEIRNARSLLAGRKYVHANTKRTRHTMNLVFGSRDATNNNQYSLGMFILPSSEDDLALVEKVNSHRMPASLSSAWRMQEYFHTMSELILADVRAVRTLPPAPTRARELGDVLYSSFASSQAQSACAEVTLFGAVKVRVTYGFTVSGYITKVFYDLTDIPWE